MTARRPAVGRCTRCGKWGRVELDHPTGTGADGRHFHPAFVVPLCRCCHRLRTLVDRQIGVEGPRVATAHLADPAWLILRRLEAFLGCLATARRPVTFEPGVLSGWAEALADVRRLIGSGLGEAERSA